MASPQHTESMPISPTSGSSSLTVSEPGGFIIPSQSEVSTNSHALKYFIARQLLVNQRDHALNINNRGFSQGFLLVQQDFELLRFHRE
jgi:hypothetical protein